jgi:phage gpG-like protein
LPAQLEVIGLRDAQEAIRRLGLAAADTRKVRALVGEEMLRRTEERFAREVGPDGKPWKRSRRAEREGGKTLSNSGTLKSRVAYDVRGDDLDLYSWDKRARVHQLGLTIEPTEGHQYLTIPLRAKGGNFAGPQTPLITRKGRDGRKAAHYRAATEGIGRTWVARVRGKLYIFQATGDHAVRALFLLVRSVKMEERPFLGFSQDDLLMILRLFSDHFGTAFNGTP